MLDWDLDPVADPVADNLEAIGADARVRAAVIIIVGVIHGSLGSPADAPLPDLGGALDALERLAERLAPETARRLGRPAVRAFLCDLLLARSAAVLEDVQALIEGTGLSN